MYKALYRTYRPETFREVIGQEHIVRILENQIKQDEVNHAYLFSGTRGTGKTTTARLLAKGVNCLGKGDKPCGQCENCNAIKDGTFMDVIEIDAASYNGIDQVRELRNSIWYPPAQGKKKVYIIDEVHMMSNSAFNGLLKTLEEPPKWVMLILATTDPQKLPQTVRSRCMKLDFHRVAQSKIEEKLWEICQDRKINIDDDALTLVARNADGSVRDGLTLLEQCISSGDVHITREMILETLGRVDDQVYVDIVDGILASKPEKALVVLETSLQEGKDPREILNGLIGHYRSLMMIKYIKNPEDILNMSAENIKRMKPQADALDISQISKGILELSKTAFDSKTSNQPRILLELVIMKLSMRLIDINRAVSVKEEGGFAAVNDSKVLKGKINFSEDTLKEDFRNYIEKTSERKEENKGEKSSEAEKIPPFEGDIDKLWLDVLDSISAKVPYVMAMRQTSRPVSVEKDRMVISCTSDACTKIISQNRELFHSVLAQYTGRNMIIVEDKYVGAKTAGENIEDNEDNDSNSLESYLGVPLTKK